MEDTGFVYSDRALELVKVGVEFCRYVESCRGQGRAEFARTMRALLPMLYLKAEMLGEVPEAVGYNEPTVTEADYDFVRRAVAEVMGGGDDFLEVMVADFRFSDQPVALTVSECLADVYQAVRELVEAYRGGCEEAMEAALWEARCEFSLSWGQRLLNALRAIHFGSYTEDWGDEGA